MAGCHSVGFLQLARLPLVAQESVGGRQLGTTPTTRCTARRIVRVARADAAAVVSVPATGRSASHTYVDTERAHASLVPSVAVPDAIREPSSGTTNGGGGDGMLLASPAFMAAALAAAAATTAAITVSRIRGRRQRASGTASAARRSGHSSTTAPSDATLLPFIERLLRGEREFTEDEAAHATECMLDGADEVQTAAFLALLRRNGAESAAVLAGMATTLLRYAQPFPALDTPTLDLVGTGGDGANTVNLSTAAAIVAASCGARVAKHGNRSASSLCGSADVLEALGVRIDLSPEGVAECVRQCGIGFLMAPRFHPALATVAPLRRRLRFRTVFNVLGPLINPARSAYQLLGVASPHLLEVMADAVSRLGTTRTWVVHCGGLDELAPIGPAEVIEVKADGSQRRFRVHPEELGMPLCELEDLVGGDAAANAATIQECFHGRPGPVSNAIIVNAGAALTVSGLAPTLSDGCARAAHALLSGEALRTLEQWRTCARQATATTIR